MNCRAPLPPCNKSAETGPSPFGLPFGKVISLNLASVWASVPEVELKQKQTDANRWLFRIAYFLNPNKYGAEKW